MTENKLNPFESDEEEYIATVDSDAAGREFASEQQEQNVGKAITDDVSDHAHVTSCTCSV